MKRLKLDAAVLSSEGLAFHVPKGVGVGQRERFDEWTQAPARGAIFSGYRRQILAGEGLEESLKLAATWRGRFDTLFVMGIGGSALGTKAVLAALETRLKAGESRKVVVVDNLDPWAFEAAWAGIDPAKTGFVVITKSGGTIETMSQMGVVLERLEKAGLNFRERLLAITDPKDGALRAWATREKVEALSVPPDVGGRFSVLTPVGLFPLAFAGIDVRALMTGAQSQLAGKEVPLDDVLSLGLRLSEIEEAGLNGHVLLPYASVLKEFSAWFVQLWGESLGKRAFNERRVGPIPVAAVGATDQHSLLQLLVEGPNRFVTGFLVIEQWENDPIAPKLPAEFAKLAFSEGKSFSRILNAEAQATRQTLDGLGRPTYEIRIPRLDAGSLGALLALYMDLTSAAGAAAGLNPYDQPGVELGKRILPALLAGV
jgi:glucose-6-phosphate isomerase